HPRSDRDWSSDVCSSDLGASRAVIPQRVVARTATRLIPITARRLAVVLTGAGLISATTIVLIDSRLISATIILIRAGLVPSALRSEEHTSELQSRSDLVC